MANFSDEHGSSIYRITSLASLEKFLEAAAKKLDTHLTVQQRQVILLTINKIKTTADESIVALPKEIARLETLANEVSIIDNKIKDIEKQIKDINQVSDQIGELKTVRKNLANKYINQSPYMGESWNVNVRAGDFDRIKDADRVKELDGKIFSLEENQLKHEKNNTMKGLYKELASAKADMVELQGKHKTINLKSIPQKIEALKIDLKSKEPFLNRYRELVKKNPDLSGNKKIVNTSAKINESAQQNQSVSFSKASRTLRDKQPHPYPVVTKAPATIVNTKDNNTPRTTPRR